MARGYRAPEKIANGMEALLELCRIIMSAWDSGQAEIPALSHTVRDCDLRTVPYFRRGFDPKTPDLLYTTKSLTYYIHCLGKDLINRDNKGRFNANRWIILAVWLLEQFELGNMDEAETMKRIRNGEKGFSMNALLKRLRTPRSKR